jgi:hypothetical protein
MLLIPSATNSAPIAGRISTKLGIVVAKYCRDMLILAYSENHFTLGARDNVIGLRHYATSRKVAD